MIYIKTKWMSNCLCQIFVKDFIIQKCFKTSYDYLNTKPFNPFPTKNYIKEIIDATKFDVYIYREELSIIYYKKRIYESLNNHKRFE